MKKALICFINDYGCEGYADALRAQGYEVRTVTTREEQLAALQDYKPDLVLLYSSYIFDPDAARAMTPDATIVGLVPPAKPMASEVSWLTSAGARTIVTLGAPTEALIAAAVA